MASQLTTKTVEQLVTVLLDYICYVQAVGSDFIQIDNLNCDLELQTTVQLTVKVKKHHGITESIGSVQYKVPIDESSTYYSEATPLIKGYKRRLKLLKYMFKLGGTEQEQNNNNNDNDNDNDNNQDSTMEPNCAKIDPLKEIKDRLKSIKSLGQ
jgi:hypothetical protein